MEFSNFRRLDEEPHFPKWPTKKKSTNPLTQVINLIIGVSLWVFLIMVFLVTAYLYWFNRNVILILKTLHPGNYKMPWWLSLLLLIVLGPLTLIPIAIGTLIQLMKK